MMNPLLLTLSIILISLPLIGVFVEWRIWTAFGVGIILLIYSIFKAVHK